MFDRNKYLPLDRSFVAGGRFGSTTEIWLASSGQHAKLTTTTTASEVGTTTFLLVYSIHIAGESAKWNCSVKKIQLESKNSILKNLVFPQTDLICAAPNSMIIIWFLKSLNCIEFSWQISLKIKPKWTLPNLTKPNLLIFGQKMDLWHYLHGTR